MNALAMLNDARRREIVRIRDIVKTRQGELTVPVTVDYPLAQLRELMVQELCRSSGRTEIVLEVDFIDRRQFGGDLAVKLPALLKEGGAREYVNAHVPWIVDALGSPALSTYVSRVDRKGIYVNVTLTDGWFLSGVQSIVALGDSFGRNESMSERVEVIDYSSPNVAKLLHAGHFRSTMIGHVLSNLYQACGGLVYRVNHINDFGGFGFMLEGYRRFGEYFPETMKNNDRLLEIYTIRRTLEKFADSDGGWESAGDAERELVDRYFPGLTEKSALRDAYKDFVAASDARFTLLEEGDAEEVELWSKMVGWSLADFQSFYSALDIRIDFTIGESFYLDAGNEVIEEAVRTGKAFVLTAEMVREEVAVLDRSVENEEITPAVRDKSVALLGKDLGAIVVPLPDGERFVVRRSDGRSIYATRDLGAIKLRREIFDPTDLSYVVGQEQRVHFARLFRSAAVLGLACPTEIRLRHIYFGFYVDADSGRKLSSRDSVTGVNDLLAASVEHFRKKSAEHGGMTGEEIDRAARQLAVGSIVFNDLKRDMKAPVGIVKDDLSPTILAFEKSGGPYVVYSACRARAILRRYGKPLPPVSEIGDFEVNDQEAMLILRLLEYPEKVIRAAAEDNPSVLVRFLLDTAVLYNSYYASAPVLVEGGKANNFRLLVTRAVQHVLINGLSLCHVECPSKI